MLPSTASPFCVCFLIALVALVLSPPATAQTAVDWTSVGVGLLHDLQAFNVTRPAAWKGTEPCLCDYANPLLTSCSPQWGSQITCPPKAADTTQQFVGIVGLQLQNLAASGTLPGAWATRMTDLTQLSLSNNNLGGSLPVTWSALTNLLTLDLSDNTITGTLPAEWSGLSRLVALSLQQNHLAGTIPAVWMPVQLLRVSINPGLCGVGPAWIKTPVEPFLPDLRGTSVGLPCWTDILLGVKDMLVQDPSTLDWNSSDTVVQACNPAWAGVTCDADSLVLNLEFNDLNVMALPDGLSGLTSLQTLTLGPTNVRGTLPPSYSALTNLQVFSAKQNSLHGSLPQEYSTLTALTVLELDNNQFTGSIPPTWSQQVNLESLVLTANAFTGLLPVYLSPFFSNLELQNNQFTGTLPVAWSSLSSLTQLALQSNKLTGTLPLEWSALAALTSLELGDNRLSGPVPPQWSALHLNSIQLIRNAKVCGAVPAGWIIQTFSNSSFTAGNTTVEGIMGTQLTQVCGTPSPSSSKLSGGAIAGIVIGVVAAVALVAAAVAWTLSKRRLPATRRAEESMLRQGSGSGSEQDQKNGDVFDDFRSDMAALANPVVSRAVQPSKAKDYTQNLELELHHF